MVPTAATIDYLARCYVTIIKGHGLDWHHDKAMSMHGETDLLQHTANQPANDSDSRQRVAFFKLLPALKFSLGYELLLIARLLQSLTKINPLDACSSITNNSRVASARVYSCHKTNYTPIKKQQVRLASKITVTSQRIKAITPNQRSRIHSWRNVPWDDSIASFKSSSPHSTI